MAAPLCHRLHHVVMRTFAPLSRGIDRCPVAGVSCTTHVSFKRSWQPFFCVANSGCVDCTRLARALCRAVPSLSAVASRLCVALCGAGDWMRSCRRDCRCHVRAVLFWFAGPTRLRWQRAKIKAANPGKGRSL